MAIIANTRGIHAFGLGGGYTIFLDESNGVLPSAQRFAHLGYSVLTGGSGRDQLFSRYCGGRDNG